MAAFLTCRLLSCIYLTALFVRILVKPTCYAHGEVEQERAHIMDTEKWKTYEARRRHWGRYWEYIH